MMKKNFFYCLIVGFILVGFVGVGLMQGENETMTAEQVVKNMKTGKFSGEPMDFNFKDADLKNVLMLFQQVSGLEFIIKPGVEGKITFKADKIPWDKALLKFFTDNNLKFKAEENKLVVWKEKK